ncbi:MAG: PQQ-binding-like beta-propeller repeat protein [Verrucomicrobia bacterium]|nr:PQQ-binding-like beta-propeller repeat protein [Verrucomicrobiota bacterium]
MKTTVLVLGIALLAAVPGPSSASDEWPRFRGPDGSGLAAGDARPPTNWSATSNLKWKAALPGPGSSSPIIWGERVFVTCYSGYGEGSSGAGPEKLQRHLVCLQRNTGNISWDKSVPAELPEDEYSGNLREHGYASNTPVTDGERVYVFFGKTGVLAFDFDGRQLWKVNVGKQSSNRRWGSAASPILCQNTVIINAAEEGRSVLALDKLTGKEVWKTEVNSLELSFVTPVLVECAGGRSDLALAVPGEMWGLNPATGKLRWFAQTGITGNVSPSVVAADGVVYATGGYPRQGTIAVRAGGKGDVTQTNVLWSSQSASYVPSPVVYHGHLYVVSDQGSALCLEANTGKLVYKERLPGVSGGKPFYASVVLADGHLYATSRRSGTFVMQADPAFALLAQNKLAGDDTDFNGTPAIAGRQIFLRSNRFVYCIESGAGG